MDLSAARYGDPPSIYVRVGRVKKWGSIKVYLTGKLTVRKTRRLRLVALLRLVVLNVASSGPPHLCRRVGSCTWSSISENVPLMIDLMDNLVQLLRRDKAAAGTFSLTGAGRICHADRTKRRRLAVYGALENGTV